MPPKAKAKVDDDETIKNRIHDDPEFKKNLKVQAASDSRHDLGTDFTRIYNNDGITRIGTPHNEFEATKGVGWDIVDTVIETPINIPKDTVPLPTVFDTIREDIPPIIINFSKFEYKLTTMNINDKTKALTLFNFINGSEDTDEVCLIMDSTMGPFQKILEKVEAKDVEGSKKTVYLVVNREAVSDPAGKPNEKDAAFNDKNNKKRHVAVRIALDATDEKVTYPKWIDPRENYQSDFFSDFNLELTPVKYGVSKSVILTFSGKDYTDQSIIETSAAGKLANSKNTMMKLLKRIGTFIAPLKGIISTKDKKRQGGTEQNHKDLQDYFVALQKKRSGDTLIALSFFDTSRIYNSNKENFTFKEKKRFVLTHDTFNTLPICLINGADVIYTGETTVYKFERTKEKTDFIKAFFDTHIKTAANRSEMLKLLEEQLTQYIEKRDEILTEIQEALDTFEESLKVEGKGQGQKSKGYLGTAQIDKIKKSIRKCLQSFFKLCLFRSLYMPTVSTNKLISDINLLKSKKYETMDKDNIKKIETIKEQYYVKRSKVQEYADDFKHFNTSYKNNLVYKEIDTFNTVLQGNGMINFGMKANKFTFGASSVIHHYLLPTDGTDRFIEILDICYKNPNISRLEKNKAPMKEVLSFFISFTPLLAEEEGVGDNQEENEGKEEENEGKEEEKGNGFSFCEDDKAKVEKQTSSVLTSRLLDAAHGEIGTVTDTNKDHGDQSVASPSCVVPYHEGIRVRIESFAKSLMSTIKSQLQTENSAKAKAVGGGLSQEKALLELQSFLLMNYMVEMSVYFKGEHDDPNIDIYGQNIPMAGKLFLHAMKHSLDPRSIVFFFMKMSYYADDKASFEKDYMNTLKGNTSLYFLPCIFENIIYNAFGPDFLEEFQAFSITYFPKILRTPKLKALVPTIPDMTNPKWESVEEEMKMKIRQVTKNINEVFLHRPAQAENQTLIKQKALKVRGGYRKTKKSRGSSNRNKTRRGSYKK
jgi:hypothetical protein